MPSKLETILILDFGGQPSGKVVDPVSLRAGVVGDGWLPRTARAMAHAVQQGTSREAKATAGEFGRLPYCRASFERVAHLVGALAVADHQDIEDSSFTLQEMPSVADNQFGKLSVRNRNWLLALSSSNVGGPPNCELS